MAALNPEDVDQMAAAAQQGLMPEQGMMPQGQVPTEGMIPTAEVGQAPMVDTGADNYTAGLEANEANPMSGLI